MFSFYHTNSVNSPFSFQFTEKSSDKYFGIGCTTLAFKSMASPEVWEEMSDGDMSTVGEGSIVAGIGVDVAGRAVQS
jgi:hypothetical protein